MDTNTISGIRTIFMVVIVASGLVFLCGSLLRDILPQRAVIIAAAVFVLALVIFLITGKYTASQEEKRYMQALRDRKTRTSEIEALGFSATFKSVGSSRFFAVDEAMGKWILIDYYNDPLHAKLHDLSSIKSVSTAYNAKYIPKGHRIYAFNGKKLNKADNKKYYNSIGIAIESKEKECPYEFINCFKTENDVDIIFNYLQNLLGEQGVTFTRQELSRRSRVK
ncbi:MAG: hypothetical protein ACOYJB_07790 [Christensenellaceae bacterium]